MISLEGYFIRCIDLTNMPEEENCPVCQIDHEVLFDFDEEAVTREEIAEAMVLVADNLKAYLVKALLE